MHLYHSKQSTEKAFMKLFIDVYLLGQSAYVLNVIFQDSVDFVGKTLLMIFTLVLIGYRIRSMHLDNEKKEIDNRERKLEIKQKHLDLIEREGKIKETGS